METKTFKFRQATYDDDTGSVKAVFATLNTVDLDGDLTLPGAFGQQRVVLSAFNHGTWKGALPVGKGRIYEDGDKAIFEGRFFIDTQTGLEHYRTIKAMGDLQQWSYALPQIDFEYRQINGVRVRVLKRIMVPEVSPVLMGAGIGTRTLEIKGSEDEQKANAAVVRQALRSLDRLDLEELQEIERKLYTLPTEPISAARRTAYHESAHALVSKAVGGTVHSVSIGPDSDQAGLCKSSERGHAAKALTLVAGYAVESMLGQFHAGPMVPDWRDATDQLVRAGVRDTTKALAGLARLAKTVLTANLMPLGRLVAALEQKRELARSDVDRLLAGVTPVDAAALREAVAGL